MTDARAAAALAELDAPADHDAERSTSELVQVLGGLGLGVLVPTDKVDDPEDEYAELLRAAAACSGGSVLIDDIELVEDEDGEESLHFRRNGRSFWWALDHESTAGLDLTTVLDSFGDLAPGENDPREFFPVAEQGDFAGIWHILVTPDQAHALREEFDLPVDSWGRSGPLDGELPEAPDTLAWYLADDLRYMDEESRSFLDRWLTGMDTALARWRAEHLPADFPFDFSLDSLSALEDLILDRYDSSDAVKAAAADGFVDGAVRYLGETAIRAWPARWSYQHSDVPSLYANVPLIRSNTPQGFEEVNAPLWVFQLLAEEREPGSTAFNMGVVEDAADRYRKALEART
ncbi:hypothetical protein [Saccharopolyspora indica]|uniref:hypothetical protein n=1 Tax=Saccharopolyspora indica TaxID=1229659 RepID=UPI002FE5367D